MDVDSRFLGKVISIIKNRLGPALEPVGCSFLTWDLRLPYRDKPHKERIEEIKNAVKENPRYFIVPSLLHTVEIAKYITFL